VAKYFISKCFFLCWYHCCTVSCLMIFSPQQIILAWSNKKEWDGRRMWHVWKSRGLRKLKERKHSQDLDREDNTKMDIKEIICSLDSIDARQTRDKWWTLWTFYQTFDFHRMWGISW
jgi:hypothetical protein